MSKKTGTAEKCDVKVRVLTPFCDKFDGKVSYSVGTVLEFDTERAADVVGRGLAEYVKEAE